MKITHALFLIPLLFVTAHIPASAQDAGSAAKPAAPTTNVTAEQREKLVTASTKALKDPEVIAAQKSSEELWNAYRVILKKKVIASDPSVQPLFDKADKATQDAAVGKPAEPLTPEERKTLHDAVQKVTADPEILEAMKKLDDSKKSTMAIIRAAILKADPSLQPIIETIGK